MANDRRGNVSYIDAVGTLTSEKNVKVAHIFITATAANAVLILSDPSDNNVIELRAALSGQTEHFDLVLVPLTFPNGVKAKTVTNCTAAIVYTSAQGLAAT